MFRETAFSEKLQLRMYVKTDTHTRFSNHNSTLQYISEQVIKIIGNIVLHNGIIRSVGKILGTKMVWHDCITCSSDMLLSQLRPIRRDIHQSCAAVDWVDLFNNRSSAQPYGLE